jgi:Zn-dependent peptidase ImmA (M78 family)
MVRLRRSGIQYLEGDAIPPANLSKAKTEEFAARVTSVLGFKIGQDPARLVARLGGKVHYQDIEEWIEENGSIFVHGEHDFDILLPHYTSPLRDRFTVAHELGHYFLHSDQGAEPIIAYRRGSTRIEWEANWFAAALLMPKHAFEVACKETGNITRIALQFGVSQEAAKVRKDALGL